MENPGRVCLIHLKCKNVDSVDVQYIQRSTVTREMHTVLYALKTYAHFALERIQ